MATYKATQSATYAMDKFVPAIWSARILSNLHDNQILANLMTREYEGEIKGAGDTVKVHGVGSVTINDYVVNSTSITWETPADAEILVEVTDAKYFAFKVEDIEKAQASPQFVNELSKEAAIALAKNTDNYLYNVLYDAAVNNTADGFGQRGGASSTNGGVMTLTTTSAAAVYESMVDIGVRLDDLLCPDEGRFIIVPALVKGLLLKDDRFVAAAVQDKSARDKGKLGTVAGFEVYSMPKSSFTRWDGSEANAVVADNYSCIAGRKGSAAYVEQLTKTENVRLESSFADGVRGLLVRGNGVIRPQHLIVASADDPLVAS